MTEPKYYLEIESTPNNLITVEEFVNYFSVELGLDQEKINGLLLAKLKPPQTLLFMATRIISLKWCAYMCLLKDPI